MELKSSPQPGTALPVKAYLEDRSEPLTFPGALRDHRAAAGDCEFQTFAAHRHGDRGPLRRISRRIHAERHAGCEEHRAEERFAAGVCGWRGSARGPPHWGTDRRAGTCSSFRRTNCFWPLTPAACRPDARSRPRSITGATAARSRSRWRTFSACLRSIRLPWPARGRPSGPGSYQVTGQNLEMIEKLGWDGSSGLDVSGLPTPLPGPGLKQSILVNLPDPPAHETCLYVWLRGDKQGRLTTIKAPVLPVAAPTTPAPSTASQTANGESGSGAGTPPAATAALTQTADKAITVTSISSAPSPSSTGQVVTFTAVVAVSPPAGGSPVGTVTFVAGDRTLGTGTLDATGKATFSTSSLPAGTYTVQAVYEGSPAFAGSSSSTITQAVQ